MDRWHFWSPYIQLDVSIFLIGNALNSGAHSIPFRDPQQGKRPLRDRCGRRFFGRRRSRERELCGATGRNSSSVLI